MYGDTPLYNIPADAVLVLEGTETDPDLVVEEARRVGASCPQHPDGEIFYIVFANTPRRIDPMTERILRLEIRGQQRRASEG